ncbi:CAAX protease [Cupriavidus plantarum]|uniref:CAAX protease n=1 Tax=Cupriavidus plantarum TaxID=942865 RepID=UPI00339D4CC2
MPRSLPYRPLLIERLITATRLKSYETVFGTHDDLELVGAYLWNSAVAATFLPVLSAAEITLRNAVDAALRPALGEFWWRATTLHFRSFKIDGPVPGDVKGLRDNFAAATKLVKRDRKDRYGRADYAPSHHDIIAKTNFSTWEYILSSDFAGDNLIWPKHLGKVFAGPWPFPKARKTLTHARLLVSNLRCFRNRLSHHEPLWKTSGVHSARSAMAHLHEKIDAAEYLLQLIHPASLALLQKSGILPALRRTCREEELKRYQHASVEHRIGCLRDLQLAVTESLSNNRTVDARVSEAAFRIHP